MHNDTITTREQIEAEMDTPEFRLSTHAYHVWADAKTIAERIAECNSPVTLAESAAQIRDAIELLERAHDRADQRIAVLRFPRPLLEIAV